MRSYHPAEVGAHDEWKGKTWKDMPGTDSDSLYFTEKSGWRIDQYLILD